jgi:hypothetical protein
MNNFLSQLNLTTQERRIVVIIFLVVIVVLNLLFVWPHFGEWGRIKKELGNMYRTIETDNGVIAKDLDPTNGWKKQVDKMARQEGGSKIDSPVDPQNQLQQTIYQQERKTGVTVASFNPGSVKTNEFFEEHSTTITFESQEPQLVSFLYGMGNDPAMIRVAKLDLKPADNNRYRLKGGITLTANYARKAPSGVSAGAAAKPAAGTKAGGAAAAKAATAPGNKPGPVPAAAQTAKHLPGGPPGLGGNRQPPLGGKPPMGPRPNPLSKLAPAPNTGSDQKKSNQE